MGEYPYLATSLVLLLLAMGGLFLCRAQRRLALISGVAQAPFGLLSVAFVPQYWRPQRIAEFLAGPEDLLFSFSNGILIWLLCSCGTQPITMGALDRRAMVRRYFSAVLPATALGAVLLLFGTPVMVAALVAIVVVVCWVLTARRDMRSRDLFVRVLRGLFGFGLIYVLVLYGAFSIWPDFDEQWNRSELWGITLSGSIPLEEVVWALTSGAAWPVFMMFLLGPEALATEGRTKHRG